MSYKIPSDEEVVSAIQRVISKHHTIHSQHLLKEMVEDELRTVDNDYRVSGLRIRKLVLKSKYFHLEIDYKSPPEPDEAKISKAKNAGRKKKRKGKVKKKKKRRPEPKLKVCPVCGSKVKKIRNRTLRGGLVTTGFKCSYCPYHTGVPAKLPAKYTFSIRRL